MSSLRIGLFFGDGLIGHETLNELFPDILGLGYEVVLFSTCKSNSKKSNIPELAYTNFYETTLLNKVVMPFLDQNKPLLNSDNSLIKNMHYSLEQLIQHYNLEYYHVADVNAPEFIDRLARDDRMVGAVSVRNYQVFKREIINLFKEKGFLWNLHTGILPKYKGVYIPYRCLENGASEYGWTLHYVDEGVDTGDIIAVDSVPLDYKKPVFDIYLGMSKKGARLILKELSAFKDTGELPKAKPQTRKEKQSYYTFPTAQEMAKYDEMGICFVDISKVPDMYVSKFSMHGTGHAQQLRMRVIKAIGEYERQKEELSAIRTKRSSVAG